MNFQNFDKTVPYIKRDGILGYFQLLYHNFFDLILLNLIFILTSLPIFTIGASLVALNKSILRMVQDEPASYIKDYFYYFKKHFKNSIISGIVFLSAFCIISFAILFYFEWAKATPIFYFAAFICCTCLILLLLMGTYYFPMLAEINLKKTELIKNSFIFSISNLKNNLFALSVYLIFAVSIIILLPYGLIIMGLLLFSICSLTSCFIAWQQIQLNIID